MQRGIQHQLLIGQGKQGGTSWNRCWTSFSCCCKVAISSLCAEARSSSLKHHSSSCCKSCCCDSSSYLLQTRCKMQTEANTNQTKDPLLHKANASSRPNVTSHFMQPECSLMKLCVVD